MRLLARFRRKWRNSMLIRGYADQPHVQHDWAQRLEGDYFKFLVRLSKVTCHAPWLNSEALAYRRAMNQPTVNGFFIN